jgi:hypothetical protein
MKNSTTKKISSFFLTIFLIWFVVFFLSKQETDIAFYSEKYYNTFSPLLKYDCVYQIDLDSMKLNFYEGYNQKNFNSISDSLYVTNFVKNNLSILKHMKNKKVLSIDFWKEEDFVQVWYHDYVVEISYDSVNKTIKTESQPW